ncbi:hypothetical protein [Ruegeria sp. HKCCD7318]|uniref:hypothetical protein n=1 Tax=Ruegeria sp. HKCCD7318 TaxID=2683014 RepID=UPI00149325B1|nr:hypothetical protein [Ruegeria sp. HKCCD7318]NOE34410.1 hypothetical protein [Ruegeria sp. HKCCD7318]
MGKPTSSPSSLLQPDYSDPYVDWWALAEGSRTQRSDDCTRIDIQPLERNIFGLHDKKKRKIEVPLPEGATNTDFSPNAWESWEANAEDYPHIRTDDVILGVIDTSFALGQKRLRFENGQSRLLAAWLQGADARKKGARHLPFGREFSTVQIEAELRKHSGGDLKNPLNQESFNRATGAVDADKPSWEGAKELQLSASHGTHILDVAGGINPGALGASLDDGRPRCHLVAISLPPLFLHGHAGNFLQYHAVLGLIRIIRLADAISAAKHKAKCPGFDADHQFPVVVNFSFGFEAGPKDGSLEMEQVIRNEIRNRACDFDDDAPLKNRKRKCRPRKVKTFVNMPAGNSNLMRVSGRDLVKPDGHEPFEVIVQPSDHSSTYVEFWSEPFNKSSGYLERLELQIDLPDGRKIPIGLKNPGRGAPEVQQISSPDNSAQIGRVYYNLNQSPLRAKDQVRLRVVVALAPTLVFFPMKNQRRNTTVKLAPAGRWKFTFKGIKNTLRFDAYIQADLFGGPLPQNARRAYFDHRLYRDYLESGHVRDSYSYCEPDKPLDNGPISRVGTHNALASTPYVSMIGGYRNSDGRPATYSATGYHAPPAFNSQSDVDVIFPCDDSDTKSGILGAGPRDGAALAMNGTSVATALSSRMMIDCLLTDPDAELGQPWLQTQARNYANEGRPEHYKHAAPLKAGAGHLPYPDSYCDVGAGVGMRARRGGRGITKLNF